MAMAKEFYALPEEKRMAFAMDNTNDVPQGYSPISESFHRDASWSNVLGYVLRPQHLTTTDQFFPSASFRYNLFPSMYYLVGIQPKNLSTSAKHIPCLAILRALEDFMPLSMLTPYNCHYVALDRLFKVSISGFIYGQIWCSIIRNHVHETSSWCLFLIA